MLRSVWAGISHCAILKLPGGECSTNLQCEDHPVDDTELPSDFDFVNIHEGMFCIFMSKI